MKMEAERYVRITIRWKNRNNRSGLWRARNRNRDEMDRDPLSMRKTIASLSVKVAAIGEDLKLI
jgi:hypothetical protein